MHRACRPRRGVNASLHIQGISLSHGLQPLHWVRSVRFQVSGFGLNGYLVVVWLKPKEQHSPQDTVRQLAVKRSGSVRAQGTVIGYSVCAIYTHALSWIPVPKERLPP